MKTIFKWILFFAIFISVFNSIKTQNSSAGPWKTVVSKNALHIAKQEKNTVVSAEGLKLTAIIRKPETVPISDDPSAWKVKSETQVDKFLFSQNGKLTTSTYITNIGEMQCETWISDNRELLAFRQSIINRTKKPILLNYLYPLYINKDEPFAFGNISNWRILKQYREKNDFPHTVVPAATGNSAASSVFINNFDGTTIVPKGGSNDNCDPFLIINNSNGNGKNLLIGYQTYYFHQADISISFDDQLKLNEISANCKFERVEVPTNGIRTSQWAIITLGDDPNKMMSEYAIRTREFHHVAVPGKNAPSAYCTWYYYGGDYNETYFREDIAQFRKERIPFDVFLIDACWDNDNWGDFETNTKKFPSGMKHVADEIKSLGYIPGIWTCPFIVCKTAKLVKDKPEWLLKNSKGEACIFPMGDARHFILDLTYPGVTQYLEDQYRKISKGWGFRYFKFDFMRAVYSNVDQQFYDKSATSLEAYRMGLEAIRRGTGNDAYISVCGGHYGGSFGIANSQRSGSDVLSIWNEKELYKYRQNILRTWMADLWHVDPDAMMVRRYNNNLPFDEYDLTLGLFTNDEAFTNAVNQFIGGNLVTFSEKFSSIDEDRKMLYKHVIPSANASSRPLDIFNPLIPETMVTHIKPVCRNLGDWQMLTIVNWFDYKKDYRIALDDRSLETLQGNTFIVFDFRSQSIISKLNRGDTLVVRDVKPHNSKLLKIVPWDGKSALFVGTDLNFACGGVEISDIFYKSAQISGILDTPWYLPVTLTFLVSAGEGFEMKRVSMLPGQRHFFLDY